MAKEKEKCPICHKLCLNVKQHLRLAHPEQSLSPASLSRNEESPNLGSLTKMAKMVGLDIDTIKAELVNDIVDIVKEKLPVINTVAIETRLSGKLFDSLESINLKLTQVVEEVRGDLLGKLSAMESAIQPLVQQVVQANIPAMCETIAGQLEENIRKNPPQGGGNSQLGAIVSKLPAEFWANLASTVFGRKPESDLATLIKGIRLGNALRTGNISADEIEKAIKPEK